MDEPQPTEQRRLSPLEGEPEVEAPALDPPAGDPLEATSPPLDPQPRSPLEVAAPARDEGAVGGIAWGPALGRAALRGLLLGVVLGLALMALVLALFFLSAALEGSTPRTSELLKVIGSTALCGLFAGVAVMPLALVEALAATRTRKRTHVAASVLTFPLALLVIPLLVLQIIYTVNLVEDHDPAHAADQTLRAAGELAHDFNLPAFLLICALLPAIPLTTYARLRRFSHRMQLATVVPGTLLLAFPLTVAGLWDAPGSGKSTGVVSLCAVSMILGALLPGAYLRGDQLERWVVRKIRPDGD